MHYLCGTSGFSYKEWKGNFYPEKIAAEEMLRYYAERLPALEIDNTFYRLPRREVLAGWAGQVPDEFRFALKASRRITHFKRLKDVEDETDYLLRVTETLGSKLGAILFQLPPDMKKDRDRLERFLDLLPKSVPAVFEFRAAGWFEPDILELLRERARPLCLVDAGEDAGRNKRRTKEPGSAARAENTAGAASARGDLITATASWGYLRLRREEYDDDALRDWARKIAATGWDRALVFFKHEDAGAAPALARRFLQAAGAAEAGVVSPAARLGGERRGPRKSPVTTAARTGRKRA